MSELSASDPDDPNEISASLDVSRETAQGLLHFAALLRRWTKTVNLISPRTLPNLWSRHMRDSAQVFHLVRQPPALWLDVGSGGGLPAIVCALMAKGLHWPTTFTLVESDKRKAAFLATACRELDLPATIRAERIEHVPPLGADLITARAFAPLDALFEAAAPHIRADTVMLFPKGARYREEIAQADPHWRFTLKSHPSITEPEARILECTDLSRRQEVSQR
ncbi:MAG: 16S rRNA (guanine(527)-N(7))-methyltransferase RsmG [Pseudomonadota bacterium]